MAKLEFVSEPDRTYVYYECAADANASTCSQECSGASCSGTIPGRRRALSEDSRKKVAGATSKFVGVCACVSVCVCVSDAVGLCLILVALLRSMILVLRAGVWFLLLFVGGLQVRLNSGKNRGRAERGPSILV